MLLVKVLEGEGKNMKRIGIILILAIVLTGYAPLFAAESESAGKPAHKTVFNWLSDCFSSFDKRFTRPGNTQKYWAATADWVRQFPN